MTEWSNKIQEFINEVAASVAIVERDWEGKIVAASNSRLRVSATVCGSVSIVFWNCCIRFINGPCLIGGCGGRLRFGVSAARPLIPVLMH